ncbi:MAG: hypothetical protein Q9195_000481 [Heterodermia aff. obscurata]
MERLRNAGPTVNTQHLDEDQARILRAQQGQLEALGVNRRQCLTESEFKEKRGAVPRASDLEATRRVNLRNTVESRVSDSVKGLLSGWSNAWTALANDDGARENLQDINAGQTHRANLTLRVSEQQSDDASDFLSRGSRDAGSHRVDRARGGGRGGRGGGIIGGRKGRVGPTRVPIGLETIADASTSTATNSYPTTRGGHSTLSHLNGLSTTNGTILHDRQLEDLAARGRRHAFSSLPTPSRSSRDSMMRPPSTAKPEPKSATPSVVGSAGWEPYLLTDPDSFMAKAGRQSAVKTESTKTASEIVSSKKTEHALPFAKPALPTSSQNLVMPDSYNAGSDKEQILLVPSNSKEIAPARPSMAKSESNIQKVRSETRVRDPQSDQLNRTTQALVMNDTAFKEKQQAVEQDREKLQRLKEIVAQMGGLFCADILSHIETLERKLSPSSTAALEVLEAGQTTLLSDVSASAVIAQADSVLNQSASNAVTARQELLPHTSSSQQKIVQVQAEPSLRRDSGNSISTTKATGVSAVRIAETATTSHKDQHKLKTNTKATATATTTTSMHIKEVKQNTVKIGAIFGEHIQKSHFLVRPSKNSIASSVASTADDIGSVSASFSQLTLQQRDSPRSIPAALPTTETAAMSRASTQPLKSQDEKRTIMIQSKPKTPGSLKDATARQFLRESTGVEGFQPMTAVSAPNFNKPSESDQPIVTPQITMRKDAKLSDNVFTRQYSPHVAVSPQVSAFWQPPVVNEPPPASGEMASTSALTVQQPEIKDNLISRQPGTHNNGSTEARYASTNPFAQQQGSAEVSSIQSGFSGYNDTAPFSKRFNTAPYRRDEPSGRADRVKDSSATKPMPKIPDFLRTLRPEAQDPGAAARRQYDDPVNRQSPSAILSERVPQQMMSSQASSVGSGFAHGRPSIATSNPLARPSQGSANSENLRPGDKKASQNAARRGPK